MLEIRTLGGLFLILDGITLNKIGSRKAEGLMVYMALENRPIDRQILSSLFWPESSQQNADVSLRVALSKLRKYLDDYLIIHRDFVEINANVQIKVDYQQVIDLIANGQIESALKMYKGDFLAGFLVQDCPDFEDWQRSKQQQIKKALQESLKDAIDIAIATKDTDYGLKLVRVLFKIDPLEERAYQQSMLLYAIKGDQSAVVRQYEECARTLQTELGIQPAEETQALYNELFTRRLSSMDRYGVVPNNLPSHKTSFIGRKVEIFRINKMIHEKDCRLVSLVGLGGSGKTRIALETANLIQSSFMDGVYFLPCEDCPGKDFLISAIGKAINFHIDYLTSRLDPETQLLDYLRKRHLLLILDGFETLVSEVEFISKLLERVPGLKVLITSRQALDLRGEWIFELSGLPILSDQDQTPLKQIDAIRLFCERAKQSNQDFYPTDRDYQWIADICRIVEGMPLGIELAAAWTSLIPVGDIKREVEKNLDFLMSDLRDLPERHHSIRAVFNGSWNLLNDDQKEDLCKISIFKGDFDRQAALEVSGLNLDGLSSLVTKSLLLSDHKGRFCMHNLIRQFAFEKFVQHGSVSNEITERYSQYYIRLLTQQEVDLLGLKMLEARDEIRKEYHHVHAAIKWACCHWEMESVQKALNTYNLFFAVHGWHEGVVTFNNLADHTKMQLGKSESLVEPMESIIVMCRSHQAFLLSNLGRIDESDQISKRCVNFFQKLRYEGELSECLHNLGVNASFRGEYEDAKALLEEAIRIGRACDHKIWPTYLLWLGHVYFLLGEYEQGMFTLQKCRDLFQQKGTLWGIAFAVSKMGLAADGLKNHDKALQYHQKALEVFKRIENQVGIGYSLSRMSMSACFLGNFEQALKYGKEALELFDELGHRWEISCSLSRIGFAYIGMGLFDFAQENFSKALEISDQNQMEPLSLYALAGLCCVMMKMGQEKDAFELMYYVKYHPKTPKTYLDQAYCVANEFCRSMSGKRNRGEFMYILDFSLEEVINRYLDSPEIIRK